MKQLYPLLFFMLIAPAIRAQNVGINSDGSLPNANAQLDVKSGTKGLLIPRMDSTARLAIANTKGLLVYDTSTASFWYNTGSGWQNMTNAANVWSTTGNAGTVSGTNFIGTTDNTPLTFMVNNTESGYIDASTGNTFLGLQAGLGNPPNYASQNNVAIGPMALGSGTTGSRNIAIGLNALNATGLNNATPVSGSDNIAIGLNALGYDSKGIFNIGLGVDAGFGIVNGRFNVAIGAFTDGSADLSNTVALGYGANATADNTIQLGGPDITAVNSPGTFNTTSDGRFKYNIREDVKGLDFILRLRPVTYQFDAKKLAVFTGSNANPAAARNGAMATAYQETEQTRRTGFVAQEVEKAAADAGYAFDGVTIPKTDKQYYSLSYASFVVPLVKAIQEQQRIIDAQDSKITDLQAQLNELKKLIAPSK
jgi:hypothetical protein